MSLISSILKFKITDQNKQKQQYKSRGISPKDEPKIHSVLLAKIFNKDI